MKGLKKKNDTMSKKSAIDIHWAEIISLIILGFVIIFFIFPLGSSIWAYVRHEPNPEIQKQFSALVSDIKAVPPKQTVTIPFAVSKDKEEYQLLTKKACTEKQTPEKDNCLKKAELCLKNFVDSSLKQVCKKFEHVNFQDDSSITPSGTSVKIEKDADEIVSIE